MTLAAHYLQPTASVTRLPTPSLPPLPTPRQMVHTSLKLEACPAFLFEMPKTTRPEHYADLSARDGLCVEHLNLMNAAFCRFYGKLGCQTMPPACADGGAAFTDGARRAALSQGKCADEQSGCASWAAKGECTNNPSYMHSTCAKACGSCTKSIDELLPHERWHGDWKHAARERGELIDDDDAPASERPRHAAPSSPLSPSSSPSSSPPPPPPPPPPSLGLDASLDDQPPPMRRMHPPPPGVVSAEDDISGYGHPSTQRQSERRRAMQTNGTTAKAALICGLGVAAIWLAAACWSRRRRHQPKLEAKCAV